MNQKKLEKIIKACAIGKKNFILKYGVIRWGGPMALIFIIQGIINKSTIIEILISLIVFPIGGYFFGLIIWDINQRYISKHAESE